MFLTSLKLLVYIGAYLASHSHLGRVGFALFLGVREMSTFAPKKGKINEPPTPESVNGSFKTSSLQ